MFREMKALVRVIKCPGRFNLSKRTYKKREDAFIKWDFFVYQPSVAPLLSALMEDVGTVKKVQEP